MKIIKVHACFFILVLLSTAFACSKKKGAPAPSTTVEVPVSLVTTYTGSLSYTKKDGTVKANDDTGTAMLTKSSTSYTLSFSDGVPSLSGLKFSQANGAYTTIGIDGSVTGISIQAPNIDITVTKDGNTWAFSGTK